MMMKILILEFNLQLNNLNRKKVLYLKLLKCLRSKKLKRQIQNYKKNKRRKYPFTLVLQRREKLLKIKKVTKINNYLILKKTVKLKKVNK